MPFPQLQFIPQGAPPHLKCPQNTRYTYSAENRHAPDKQSYIFCGSTKAGMLILGLGVKAKFLSLGLKTVRFSPWACGLGLECSGLGIKYKAIHYCLKYGTKDHTMYFFNVLHTVFLLNNYHRHHYFIVVFLENSEMTQNWRINCGILPTIYVRILGLGLGSVALTLHVSGLGLDTSGLVNIPEQR